MCYLFCHDVDEINTENKNVFVSYWHGASLCHGARQSLIHDSHTINKAFTVNDELKTGLIMLYFPSFVYFVCFYICFHHTLSILRLFFCLVTVHFGITPKIKTQLSPNV